MPIVQHCGVGLLQGALLQPPQPPACRRGEVEHPGISPLAWAAFRHASPTQPPAALATQVPERQHGLVGSVQAAFDAARH